MTIETHYTVRPLVSGSGQAFDQFYRIYLESIFPRERKPKTQISAIVSRSDYQVLLLNQNDVIAGFSILFTPPNASFCLLEYMAVDSAYRNLGIGKTLFFQSLQTVFKKQGIVPCLLEVDSDREQAADQETRRKRQRFYRSLGCLRIERLSYVLPLQGEGSPPEMDLFVYYPGLIPKIGKQALEHWLKVIYSKVYECSPDDSRIASMLGVVGDPLILI